MRWSKVSVKRAKFCMAILHHIFYMMPYEKIRRFEEKEDIFKIPNSLASVNF
jgi:hypothetical protein